MGFPTKAQIGIGVVLKRGDGASPEVFTALAELKGVKGPGARVSSEDATNFDSTNNYMEFIPGMIDPGELDLTLNFADGAAYKTMQGDQVARAVHNYQLVWPAGTASGLGASGKLAFAGFIMELEPSIDVTKIQGLSAKLKITGPITAS